MFAVREACRRGTVGSKYHSPVGLHSAEGDSLIRAEVGPYSSFTAVLSLSRASTVLSKGSVAQLHANLNRFEVSTSLFPS